MPQAIRQLSAFAVHSRKHWLSIAQKAKRRVYYREEFNSKIRNRFFLTRLLQTGTVPHE